MNVEPPIRMKPYNNVNWTVLSFKSHEKLAILISVIILPIPYNTEKVYVGAKKLQNM